MIKMQMKKLASVGMMIALLSVSLPSLAAVTYGVAYGKHNLSKSSIGQFKATVETETCVFCHTPHNSAPGKKFLWNRTNSINVFQPYTATPYIDAASRGAMANLSPVSKMCMSCHDGVTALNSMANPRPGKDPVAMLSGYDQISDAVVPIWEGDSWGTNIGEYDGVSSGGGILVNDHPVSFDYDSVRTYNVNTLGNNTLRLKSDAESRGVVFWDGKVECVSCHDPHVNYNGSLPTVDASRTAYTPFLRRPNSSSGLCFACHNK